jgi:hypothetical protein
MQAPTYFTISPSQEGGLVYATNFTFQSTLPTAFKKIVWNFGDEVFEYNKRTVNHIYNYPGAYTVVMEAWTRDGIYVKDEAVVFVDYVVRDSIRFSKLPVNASMPGLSTAEPFEVTVFSARLDEPISLVFHALNSRSIPYETAKDEKWRFLIPKWYFVDASTGQIIKDQQVMNTAPVYYNSVKVGVSGTFSFYYIDESSTINNLDGCPVTLVVTVDTKNFVYPKESLIYPYHSYSNNKAIQAATNWEVNSCFPTNLKVTENFINDIFPTKWTNVPIPVMVTCRFEPDRLPLFENTPGISAADVLSYPSNNEFGATNPLVLYLSAASAIPANYYTVDEAPLYFRKTDEVGHDVSGYVFTTVTVLSPINTDVVIAASAVAKNFNQGDDDFGLPLGVPLFAPMFVSHPYENCFNKINLNSSSIYQECEGVSVFKEKENIILGTTTVVDTKALSTTQTINYELSGSSAVYGLAFNPITNKLYAADADQDKLYYFDRGITLLSSVDIASIVSPLISGTNNTPCYISIDQNEDIWVALYDSQRLLKFDSTLNYLLSAAPNGISFNLTSFETPSAVFLIAPPVVETDRENNVWACFANNLSSMVVKFSADGTQMFKSSGISVSSIPVSISINKENNAWVACYETHEVVLLSGTNGTTIKTLTGFYHPSYTTMDRNNNLWVTHGYNLFSCINSTSYEVSTWRFFSNFIANNIKFDTKYNQDIEKVEGYTSEDINLTLTENEIWGGLSTDVFNRIWLVDNEHNAAIVFNPTNITNSIIVPILPKADTNVVILPTEVNPTPISVEHVHSAQVAGDPTGNKWYQKYTTGYAQLSVYGNSTPFKVYDLNTEFLLTKVNEEFNVGEYMKSLVLPEHQKTDTENLFNDFIIPMLGDSNPTKENIGRIVYERIANFITNHGDVDSAEIKQLLSFCEICGIDYKQFGADYPAEIMRLINIFSTPKHILRGRSKYTTDTQDNIGPIINYTQTVSAGTYVYARDIRYADQYRLIQLPILSAGDTVYSLSAVELQNIGLRYPLEDNYYFFQYTPTNLGYIDNIINWDSDFTSLSYNASGFEQWYGDGEYVETLFNNLLTKKLFSNE